MLANAYYRLNGLADVPKALRSNRCRDLLVEISCSAIYDLLAVREFDFGSTYNCQWGVEEDYLGDSKRCVDFGEDSTQELQKAMDVMTGDVRKAVLSDNGTAGITNAGQVPSFLFWLSKYLPADVNPMRVRRKPGTRPVRAKCRRCSSQ